MGGSWILPPTHRHQYFFQGAGALTSGSYPPLFILLWPLFILLWPGRLTSAEETGQAPDRREQSNRDIHEAAHDRSSWKVIVVTLGFGRTDQRQTVSGSHRRADCED